MREVKYRLQVVQVPALGDVPNNRTLTAQIVNKETGSIIPEDEPVFILRARDVDAFNTILHYRGLCSQAPAMQEKVTKVLEEFYRFRLEHPDRMKNAD